MTPTVFVALLSGHGVTALSLHARWADAQRGAVALAGAEHSRRFGYALPTADPIEASQRMAAEGYVLTVTEQPVEL